MGNKKKKDKKKDEKLKKSLKKELKAVLKTMVPSGCKTECCEKYLKAESKRCRRCPCFDKVQKVA